MGNFNQQENRMDRYKQEYPVGYGSQLGQACASPVTEYTEIEKRLIELDARNEDLRSIVAGYQVKLQTVLVPQMKNEAQGGAATPRPIVSPMAERLDKIIEESRHTANILRDVFERIAL